MNIDELKEYLKFAEDHYLDLANLMLKQNEEMRYHHEHIGKVKFIRLLKMKLEP